MPVLLKQLRESDLPLATLCLAEAQEWAPHSSLFTSPQEVFGDSNALWLVALGGDEIMGIVGFLGINWIDRTAEVALGVAPKWRDKGIAKVLAQAQNDYAFNTLGLRKLKMIALADSPSCQIALSVGLTLEATLTAERLKDGQLCDVSIYSLVAGG